MIERDEAGTAARLSVPGLTMRATGNIAGVQWGKLLVNLNNALNALSGLPLRRQLAQRSWRRLLADQMAEGLAAIRAEGIRPVSPTPIPADLDAASAAAARRRVRMVLGRTMKIDPEARSSMWEDLQRGRRTEIDYLQGVITGIADRHGLDVPLSRRIVALIRQRGGRRHGFAGADAGADPALRRYAGDYRMKQIYAALVAGAALAGGASTALAAPPTVTPSPGYDARLQESRAAPKLAEPAAPAAKPVSRRYVRRHHASTH